LMTSLTERKAGQAGSFHDSRALPDAVSLCCSTPL
jgi:hypothetical protein